MDPKRDAPSLSEVPEVEQESGPREGGGTLPELPGFFSEPQPRPTASTPPPHPDLLAGRYKLLKELGRGAMGVVHKALDTRTGETVAVKFLQDDSARDGSVLDRLIYEVGLVRKLDHPNICKVLCLQSHEGRPFLAMEALRGPDLDEYLEAQGGRLPLEQVLQIMRPVAAALDLAHAQGVIHLDLKPHNLKFRRKRDLEDQLVILDFGLARPRGDSKVAGGRARLGGSRAYRPPEQTRAGKPRPTHDVYAFAVTVFELLSGAPPHLGEDLEERKARGEVPPIPGYGWGVQAVFQRALSPRAAERPQSVGAFLEELRTARNTPWWPWVLLVLVFLGVSGALFLYAS